MLRTVLHLYVFHKHLQSTYYCTVIKLVSMIISLSGFILAMEYRIMLQS